MANIEDYFEHARATELAKSDLGKKIWNFLNEDRIKDRMEAASDLGQAAVKGIADQLVAEFPDDLFDDQVKQLIGDMVRVIMTEEGFTIDQRNVDVREFPFVKGTRYMRKDWFPRIHIFRSSNDPRELCLTDTQKGEKLPPPPEGAKPLGILDIVRFNPSGCSHYRRTVERDAPGYRKARILATPARTHHKARVKRTGQNDQFCPILGTGFTAVFFQMISIGWFPCRKIRRFPWDDVRFRDRNLILTSGTGQKQRCNSSDSCGRMTSVSGPRSDRVINSFLNQ